MDSQEFGRWCLLVVLCSLPAHLGCGACDVAPNLVGCPTWDTSNADVVPITTVVKDIFGREGQGRIIFLKADGAAENIENAMSCLAADLQTRVLPESEAERAIDDSLPVLTPFDPKTGEIGISIILGRFTLTEQGNLTVGVSFERSGLDGAAYEYVLEPMDGGWSVLSVKRIGVS